MNGIRGTGGAWRQHRRRNNLRLPRIVSISDARGERMSLKYATRFHVGEGHWPPE